jgi:hypothetical protein
MKGHTNNPNGRPKGTFKQKFPLPTEKNAEKVITDLLKSLDERLKLDAAKFVLEQNRGKARQQVDLDGQMNFINPPTIFMPTPKDE